MYKKFIYWLLGKHTNILNVSVRVSDYERMVVTGKEQLERMIMSKLTHAIANEIVSKKLCGFVRRERVWTNDFEYTAIIRIIK